jgi:hypothetical protein
LKTSLLFVFFILASFLALSQTYEEQIKLNYKQSKYVLSGQVLSVYQLPTASPQAEKRFLVELEILEIQKGPRHKRILLESCDSLIKKSEEYIFFLVQTNKSGSPVEIYHEKVCPGCSNESVKVVYTIVKKSPFRRIKSPLPAWRLDPKGCGC